MSVNRCVSVFIGALLLVSLADAAVLLPGASDGLLHSDDDRAPANDFFDVTFADIRVNLLANGHDPLWLPSDSDTFDITLFNRTMNGSVWIGDGTLIGLSTLHRTGNMSLEYGLLDNELIWAGLAGFIGLRVKYSGNSEVGFMSSKFKVEYEIPFLNMDFRTDVFISQANATLEYCYVQDFSYSHLDLGGFGPLDTPLFSVVSNTLLQAMNENVKNRVEETVCDLLQLAIQGGAGESMDIFNM